MKTSFKMTSLAALTAATLALPAAAADMQDGQAKCQPKSGMTKCGSKCAGECASKMRVKAKCSANKCAPKCVPKCGTKCAPKWTPKD